MSTFELAIGTVLAHEGGYVNNPNDPGGATNFGISLRTLIKMGHDLADINHDGHVDVEDIQQMTVFAATRIYKTAWWDRYQYSGFAGQPVATKIFDTAVNLGAVQAHKLLQRGLNKDNWQLVVDGALGPKTFNAANNTPGVVLLDVYRREQLAFYQALIQQKPVLAEFWPGWERRARS